MLRRPLPMPMIRPLPKPPTGLYPGSGVAPGGQQGRPGMVHGGLGGTRPGGATPGASQPRPPRPVQIPQPPRPADYNQLLTALLQTSIRPR